VKMLKALIFLACLLANVFAKTRKFRMKSSEFTDSVAFSHDTIAFFNGGDDESVVLTKKPLVGLNDGTNKLEIQIYMQPRLKDFNTEKPQAAVVLFFALPTTTLEDVSQSDNRWGVFKKNTVASVRDISFKNKNSKLKLVSYAANGENGFKKRTKGLGFSLFDGGYIKLTRESSFMKTFVSNDGIAWNETSSIYLPEMYRTIDLKAGIRIKREKRKRYVASMEAKYVFKNYAKPLDEESEDEDADEDEKQVFDISLNALGLCSDTPYGFAALTKIDLEWAILKFFQENFDSDLRFDSVMIMDNFEDGESCEDVENSAKLFSYDLDKETKRKLRGSQRSILYFILNGYCYGACPGDPTDTIDTINRRLGALADDLVTRLQAVVPDVTEVTRDTSKRLDCELSENCLAADGRCCGYSDTCFCRFTNVTLCQNQADTSCHPAFLPKCAHDMACDQTFDITPDKQTLVLGKSHEAETDPSFRVYDYESIPDKWYLRTVNGSQNIENDGKKKRKRLYSCSVSISDDGNKIALGAFAVHKVKIYGWDTNEGWMILKKIYGFPKSLFGYSVSLLDDGTNTAKLAVGAPTNDTSTLMEGGVAYVYTETEENDWTMYGTHIIGSNNEHKFGWRVDIKTQNIVSIGYHRSPLVNSFELKSDTWVPVLLYSRLEECFKEIVDTCEEALS
jgi:hypothetical protein